MAIEKLTLRVYGILQDKDKRVLVSDEFIRGDFFTKFPGGGLELGEGTRQCVEREFMEETGLLVTAGEHIYTTDYYQQSAFRATDQIISIYYFVHSDDSLSKLTIHTKVFDFTPEQTSDSNGQYEALRWINWDEFSEESVSLPIDKIVARMIKQPTHY